MAKVLMDDGEEIELTSEMNVQLIEACAYEHKAYYVCLVYMMDEKTQTTLVSVDDPDRYKDAENLEAAGAVPIGWIKSFKDKKDKVNFHYTVTIPGKLNKSLAKTLNNILANHAKELKSKYKAGELIGCSRRRKPDFMEG